MWELLFILDNRCYCNGHASRGTIVGAVAITAASISSFGTPLRSHGAVPLLTRYLLRAVGICYHNYTLQIIRCYDCVSQTTHTTNSKYTIVLGVKQYGSSPYCILPSSVLQYIAILQYMTRLC